MLVLFLLLAGFNAWWSWARARGLVHEYLRRGGGTLTWATWRGWWMCSLVGAGLVLLLLGWSGALGSDWNLGLGFIATEPDLGTYDSGLGEEYPSAIPELRQSDEHALGGTDAKVGIWPKALLLLPLAQLLWVVCVVDQAVQLIPDRVTRLLTLETLALVCLVSVVPGATGAYPGSTGTSGVSLAGADANATSWGYYKFSGSVTNSPSEALLSNLGFCFSQAVAFALVLLLGYWWGKGRGKATVGLGDVKLAPALGVALSCSWGTVEAVALAYLLVAVSAAAHALVLMGRNRHRYHSKARANSQQNQTRATAGSPLANTIATRKETRSRPNYDNYNKDEDAVSSKQRNTQATASKSVTTPTVPMATVSPTPASVPSAAPPAATASPTTTSTVYTTFALGPHLGLVALLVAILGLVGSGLAGA